MVLYACTHSLLLSSVQVPPELPTSGSTHSAHLRASAAARSQPRQHRLRHLRVAAERLRLCGRAQVVYDKRLLR